MDIEACQDYKRCMNNSPRLNNMKTGAVFTPWLQINKPIWEDGEKKKEGKKWESFVNRSEEVWPLSVVHMCECLKCTNGHCGQGSNSRTKKAALVWPSINKCIQLKMKSRRESFLFGTCQASRGQACSNHGRPQPPPRGINTLQGSLWERVRADWVPPHVRPNETRCRWGQISHYPLIPALTSLEPEVWRSLDAVDSSVTSLQLKAATKLCRLYSLRSWQSLAHQIMIFFFFISFCQYFKHPVQSAPLYYTILAIYTLY